MSIGPAGCRINRDYARRGWATKTPSHAVSGEGEREKGGHVLRDNHQPRPVRERLVFIGTCSVTTTLVSAFTKSDNRAKVKFSFDLLEPHIGSLLLAFLCLT